MERVTENPGLVISDDHVFNSIILWGYFSIFRDIFLYPIIQNDLCFCQISGEVLIVVIKALRIYIDLGVFETTLHVMTWRRSWEFETCLERCNWTFKLLIQFIRKKQKRSYWCPTCSLCGQFMIIQNSAVSAETQVGFTQLMSPLQRQTALLCQYNTEFFLMSGKLSKQDTEIPV